MVKRKRLNEEIRNKKTKGKRTVKIRKVKWRY